MKTVILMRHAEAGPGQGLGDRDRPLTAHGEEAAEVMARWLAGRGAVPDVILASPARRTRQTVERLRAAAPGMPEPAILPALYHAAPGDILAALQKLPDAARTVLVVGHEPAIGAAARALCDGGGAPERGAAGAEFTPAAVAVVAVSVRDWAELSWGRARLSAFARPRELMRRPDSA